MKFKLIALVLVSTGAGAPALAHSGATGVVKERMEAMKTMGESVTAVSRMMTGETVYDPSRVRKAAKTILRHSGNAMTELFPEGSNGAPSQARGSVWSDWERFSTLAGQLEVAARGLSLAAENGIAPVQGGVPRADMMGGGSMMGEGGMMGASGGMMGGGPIASGMTAQEIGAMPVDAAFAMTSRVCSACHTHFRAEED